MTMTLKEQAERELDQENKLDPRQKLCWGYYIDQKSETFSNGYRSALKAGYAESTASIITRQGWFITKMRRTHLLTKAEKVIDRILDLDPVNEDGKVSADVLRVQSDQAKHVTKTLGKDEGYSERSEVVGGGGNIVFLPQEMIEKFKLAEPQKVSCETVEPLLEEPKEE
jgi:type II secretory pathway component HofQ